jgi:uncharacterized protein
VTQLASRIIPLQPVDAPPNRQPETVRREYVQFDAESGRYLLVVNGSQIFRIDDGLADQLCAAEGDPDAAHALIAEHGLGTVDFIGGAPLRNPPLRALSLNVTGECNLACAYCYAEGGSFGGRSGDMPWEVAERAVRQLIASTPPGDQVNLSFLGGEPLINRTLIRRATEFAAQLAQEHGHRIRFAITTNGTLLTEEDCEFFAHFGFGVTVSLDGARDVHDRLRPTRGGRGSYERIVDNLRPLLARKHRLGVFARITVTPANLRLRETLDHFSDLGFDSVGFSPVLSAPTRCGELQSGDLDVLLDAMIECGREFERRIIAGGSYPFANMISALEQVHRGTHRPYPCGAGASYLGVSASGGLFACHRFIEDDRAAMGTVIAGVDRQRQQVWLDERAVDRQEPCRSCWARYLCGGGCHHEVMHRGRTACDYIRGWLRYVLEAYVRISAAAPERLAYGQTSRV